MKVARFGNFTYLCTMKQVISTGNFKEFLLSVNDRDRKKIIRHIDNLAYTGIDDIKHLREQIYELRVHCGQSSYRVLFFYDRGNVIVLVCGFAKKTQKTPPSIITKAIKIRKEYYDHIQ